MKLLNWLLKSQDRQKEKNSESYSAAEPVNESIIRETFAKCEDVTVYKMMFNLKEGDETDVIVLFSEGLTKTDLIEDDIVPRLDYYFRSVDSFDKKAFLSHIKVSSIIEVTSSSQLGHLVFQGNVILHMPSYDLTLSVDTSEIPGRTPEETNTEVSILGPRDGFVENIKINSALIRRRLPSESLKYEQFTVGERSKTKVALLYFEDIIKPGLIPEVKRRISKLKVDALLNSNQFVELIAVDKVNIFPNLEYTGRPDFTSNALLKGRFALLIDGSPTALIGPVNLFLLLKSAEDSEFISIYNSFERILRIIGMSVAIFLPGFWVSLVTYHQDQIPVLLLATLSGARQGIPFPSALEALIMLGMFELFREAGSRLPLAIGQTLTVVGGLIIGDAAIRAGLTNPGIIVVIATSLVATFTLVNQSLIGVFSLLRIAIVIISAFLGLFGFLIGAFFILLYMANLRSYGLPYLAPLSPATSLSDILDNIFRKSARSRKTRPDILETTDSTRK